MSRRVRLALLISAAVAAAILLAAVLLGPWYARRRIAAQVTRATGLPCSIEDARPASWGLTLYRIRLGRPGGAEVEVDRLDARGSLSGGRLSGVRARDAVVDVRLPGSPVARFTGVEVEAIGLDSDREKPAQVRVSGNCVDLNPLLAGKAKAHFQRGRFTLIAEAPAARKGAGLDISLTVRLQNYQMTFTQNKKTVVDEGAVADILLRVRGEPGSLKVDGWDNLAAVVGWEEPPPGRE